MTGLIAGTQKHAPNGSYVLGNETYASSALVSLFASLKAAIEAVDAAHVAVNDAVTAMHAVYAKVGPVMLAYARVLRATYGNAATILADYGLQPQKKAAPRTAAEIAAAAAKAKATRAARGTASKKAKKAVKGNVTGVVVTPVTTPAAVEASAQAAPPAAPVAPAATAPAVTPPTKA